MIINKIYKPEIIYCPKCGQKLVYCYAISTKTITFSNGKKFLIRNLAYRCPKCLDYEVYFSQTTTKFSLKGVKYSMKILFQIYLFRKMGLSREHICDYLEERDIEISDRNVDILYKKMCDLINKDYKDIIKSNYSDMLARYNQIRLSIDLVTIKKQRLVVIRNSFSAEIIGCYVFDDLIVDLLREKLSLYLNKQLAITYIFTIRKDDIFVPLLKELAPNKTKFISFLKL